MIVKKNTQFWVKYFPAVTSGCLLTLSFPDAGISVIAFFALVPLLASLEQMRLKSCFYAGLITGVAHFTTLIYWIVPTTHTYGQIHLVLACAILVLLSLYLACYPALFSLMIKIMQSREKSVLYLVLMPFQAAFLWVGLEYIRTYAFTGFGWGNLGYSQFNHLKLIQIADISGVYGISFLIVLVNSTLATLWIQFKRTPIKHFLIPAGITVIILMGVYVYGSSRITSMENEIKTAKTTRISIIQGNIEQDLKWSDAFKLATVEKYIHLSKKQAVNQPDLIIWPETALPFYFGMERELTGKINQCVQSSNTCFLIGSPAIDFNDEIPLFFNRAYMLDKNADIKTQWDKHHLIPFGEYVPFGDYLTFLGKITAQSGNFSAGEQPLAPLDFDRFKTGVLICFEILFPSTAAGFVRQGADILTTITNDAWFGYSTAAMQHFSIAVLRAVENRRSLARAANTGISGFIDPTGKIIHDTPIFTDQAFTREIPVLTSLSFYTRYGDVFAIAAIVLTAVFLALNRMNVLKDSE